MFEPLKNTIQGVVGFTWPMVIISIVIIVSFRVCYIIKYKEKVVLYKELLMLSFIIYILCLFQVVTFRDDINWSGNNFIPFKEIFRYKIFSRLFFKNVLGNMILFLPYGFFISYYFQSKKPYITIVLTLIASFSIEFVQMAIGRVFDIDDILLNLIGAIVGFQLYYGLEMVGDSAPKVFKNEMFLNVVSIIFLIGLLMLL